MKMEFEFCDDVFIYSSCDQYSKSHIEIVMMTSSIALCLYDISMVNNKERRTLYDKLIIS